MKSFIQHGLLVEIVFFQIVLDYIVSVHKQYKMLRTEIAY